MSSEKLNTFYYPGMHSAIKSCRKPLINRLSASTSKLNRPNSVKKTTPPTKSTGAVDEEYFMKAFNDVPSISISSEQLDIVLEEIRSNICTKDNWEKKVEAIQKLRAIIVAFSGKFERILKQINLLDIPLESLLKDLKSHVVREACITIAFLSVNLQHKFHHFAEVVLTALMSLIQSSVKVISSSGAVCIRFILKNTHNPRLVPMLIHHINSKSTSVRCAVCEFIDLILCNWKTKLLEKHITVLKDTIRMGISDANPDARAFSRQAFWHFVRNFPGQEKIILNSLDASYRRFLYSGMIRSVSTLNSTISCANHDRPASSEGFIFKVPNSEINKINQGKIIDFDSCKIRQKEKCLTYSDVTRENLHKNKFPRPLKIESHKVNSQSGHINEEAILNNSNILTNCEMKYQITEAESRNSCHLKANTQLNKPCSEKCIESNEIFQQDWCASDKNSSVNDNIRKIIMNLSSTTFKSKVEGLVDLQIFFQSGNTLDLNDLKFIIVEMTIILEKDSTDFFGLLLDTLSELIVCHNKDLNYWLDLLMTHVLNKFSINLPKHFENRLAKVLDIIKESFPIDLQLLSLLRYFKENSQIKNIKAIAVALNYMYILISAIESDPGFTTTYVENGNNIILPVLVKIVIFAVNNNNLTNHSELQKAATEALPELYNLNFPLIKESFSQIPEKYHKMLQNIIHGKINNTDTNVHNSSSPHFLNAEYSVNHFCDNKTVESGEVLKQPEVAKTEIQDFGNRLCKQDQLDKLDMDKVPTKIKNINNLKEIPFKQDSDLHTENQASIFSSELYFVPQKKFDESTGKHYTSFSDIRFSPHASTNNENDLMCTVLKSLNSKTEYEVDRCSSTTDKITTLNQLMKLTEETSSFIIDKNFKFLLRTLYDYMSGTNTTYTILALQIISKMLNRKDITEKFSSYTELLIFQLLTLCENKNREVSETAAFCVNIVAVALDPNIVIRITVPLILTLHFPANVAAINMISTLIKSKGRESIDMYIPDLMPVLIKALDSMEVSLRKSALYCIVALYLTVGKEPLRHYLTSLNQDKIKLLTMYIKKPKENQQCLKP